MQEEKSIKDLALIWWEELELKEQEDIEREFGVFGHDEGITIDEIIYFYKQKFNLKP